MDTYVVLLTCCSTMVVIMGDWEAHIQVARESSRLLKDEEKRALVEIVARITSPGKGILAADESNGTIGKRLIAAGLANDEETRRAYREVLFSHPDLGSYLGGVILYTETLYQNDRHGTPFAQVLAQKGVLPGIKVDLGLDPLPASPRETRTKGLEDLLERSKAYYAQGARFAKWRAVIRIDGAANLPTQEAILINSAELARYAAVCQAAGLVPIVEPEILIEGDHTMDTFADVTERVLAEVYHALARGGVYLEGTLLKPQMMMAGVDCPHKPEPSQLAARTLEVLRRRVPPAVPGIMFLSGGQTEEQATTNLNLINQQAQAQRTKHPWHLSFSFGRSLQASVLQAWAGKEENFRAAVDVAGALAKVNSQAQRGEYTGPHPTLLAAKSLHETHRGWSGPGNAKST